MGAFHPFGGQFSPNPVKNASPLFAHPLFLLDA
jgi:hypothetical protein